MRKRETKRITTAFRDLHRHSSKTLKRAKNRSATMRHFRKRETLHETQDLSVMVYYCVPDCLLCGKQCEGNTQLGSGGANAICLREISLLFILGLYE